MIGYYYMSTTPINKFYFFYETWLMLWSWSEDIHVLWTILFFFDFIKVNSILSGGNMLGRLNMSETVTVF